MPHEKQIMNKGIMPLHRYISTVFNEGVEKMKLIKFKTLGGSARSCCVVLPVLRAHMRTFDVTIVLFLPSVERLASNEVWPV